MHHISTSSTRPKWFTHVYVQFQFHKPWIYYLDVVHPNIYKRSLSLYLFPDPIEISI